MSGKILKQKACVTNVFTPFQWKAYRFLILFLSFWSGSTRFYTGRTGYSLGIRQLISISKLLNLQIVEACTASDKYKKFILSGNFKKQNL